MGGARGAGSFEMAGGTFFSGDPVAETVVVGTSVAGDLDVDFFSLGTVDTAGGEALLELDEGVVRVAGGLVLTGGVPAQRLALPGVAQIIALLVPVDAIVGVADFPRVSRCQTRVEFRLARQNDAKLTTRFTPDRLPDGFNQVTALFADAFEVLLDAGVHFWDIAKDVVQVGQPLLDVQHFLGVFVGGHPGEELVRTWAVSLLALIQGVLHDAVHVVRSRHSEKSRQEQELHDEPQ